MRQKRTGLYVYKACRHFKKISGILIILVVKIIDIVHILFKEQRYLNIVNIQFVLADKVKKQVKRSFKHIQLELSSTHLRFSFHEQFYFKNIAFSIGSTQNVSLSIIQNIPFCNQPIGVSRMPVTTSIINAIAI